MRAPLAPPLDRAAAAAYRRRLAELDQELDELEANGDTTPGVRLQHERDALLHELRVAAGLGGRSRQTGGSADRARVAVRKAVAAALARISELDPPTGRLLSHTVSTGSVCRYEPDPDRPTTWQLD